MNYTKCVNLHSPAFPHLRIAMTYQDEVDYNVRSTTVRVNSTFTIQINSPFSLNSSQRLKIPQSILRKLKLCSSVIFALALQLFLLQP